MADETETKPATKSEHVDTVTGDAVPEFASVFLDLDRGKVHDDATTRLAEVVKAVGQTGGKGTVTLTVEVEPQDKDTFDGDGVVMVSAKVEAKLPRPGRAASVFWINGEKSLTRTDPNREDRI